MSTVELPKNSVFRADQISELCGFTPEEETKMQEILDRYPMLIPPYYLNLIDWDDPNDPIRKLSIPSIDETDISGSFDTSGEASNTVVPGLQHKYRETVMILSTSVCAMYCRHCFRKRLVGTSDDEIGHNIDAMATYIQEHPEISNILISGGDAFMNSNSRIEEMLETFTAIEHLDFIRFGTRTPVVLPSRIYDDEGLLAILEKYNKKKRLYVVTQFNHPKEITPEAIRAVEALNKAGIQVRNQTVMLKGINSDPAVLAELLKKLTIIGVQPYYIFQCRPVTGVYQQFQVPITESRKIIDKAKELQNGFGKHLKYAMSHQTGKIEILGENDKGEMIFKYAQAKDMADQNKIFTLKLEKGQAWLPSEVVDATFSEF